MAILKNSLENYFSNQTLTSLYIYFKKKKYYKCRKHTFNKMASAGGIGWANISPPTNFKFSVSGKLATTCGRSNTVHFMLGNVSQMIRKNVPVPPPTSTGEPIPSNIGLQSLTTKFAVSLSLSIAFLNIVAISGFSPCNPINSFRKWFHKL